jgi:translation initiation factor IF-2
MRIYEFAKKHNVSSKVLLDELALGGFVLKSHMSVIPDDGLAFLIKKYSQIKKKAAPEKQQQVGLVEKNKNISRPQASSVSQKQQRPSSSKGRRPVSRSRRTGRSFSVKKEEERPSLVESPLVVKPMNVGVFAEKSGLPVGDVIVALLRQGQVCTKNYILSDEQVVKIAESHEIETIVPAFEKKQVIIPHAGADKQGKEEEGEQRLPVVVVMGHVDHGKTSLLDYIRKTRVAPREKGGITQHLGAYQAETDHGSLVFLDTPGHAAFSKIRQRGASVADKAILVVAADDGIMPQTIESIKAIKELKLPLIVAINKIDRVPKARLEIVKRQLTQHDVLPEEWGGDVVCVPISAKTGEGVDHLLEMTVLQTELMELKAVRNIPAQGYILESKLEKGRGPVATILCRQGTLRIGDFFSAGTIKGKVTSLTNSKGERCKEVGPSTPVSITGFDALPSIGELFRVVEEEEYRRGRGEKQARSSLSSRLASSSGKETVPLIVKADTNSSLEAVLDGVYKLSKEGDRNFFVVHSGIGNISESDVVLAETTSASIAGFYVKAESSAASSARKANVKIQTFQIIYKLFEDLELRLKKDKKQLMERTKVGEAIVLKVFDIKKLGVIAGCQVREGRFSAAGEVVVKRGRRDVGKGKIKSLQRDKKVVKEVHTGFECAFLVDEFDGWQVDDIVECYLELPVSKS